MAEILLAAHILAGVCALAMVGAALGTTKGARGHRNAGRIYLISMFMVTITTFGLVALRPNLFLFVIAVFSFYLVFTGWRAATQRDGQPSWPDHLAGATMTLTGLTMILFGVWGVLQSGGSQPVILLVFGVIGLALALSDWRDWRAGPITGKARIARHLSRMMAGSIATITAAVVVNLTFLPALVLWLGPTVLITPIIFWWTARLKQGAAQGQAVQ